MPTLDKLTRDVNLRQPVGFRFGLLLFRLLHRARRKRLAFFVLRVTLSRMAWRLGTLRRGRARNYQPVGWTWAGVMVARIKRELGYVGR